MPAAMLTLPSFRESTRTHPSFRSGLIGFLLACAIPLGANAQAPVAPSMERSEIEILRGDDVVQPQAVFYKHVRDGEDPALVRGDSVGLLRVPRATDLDAIRFADRLGSGPVNVQHAMIVAGGQAVDIQISGDAARPGGQPGTQEELFVFRPPADDAFDVAVPDGVECTRLVPNSEADRRTRGRLHGDTPCKQVPGVETVVDVAAWYDASLTNSRSGMRATRGAGHTTRELRGRLHSLAPGGEKVRFVMVVTPSSQQRATGPAPVRLDTVVFSQALTIEDEIRVETETVSRSGVDWITTMSVLQGPSWGGLPGQTDPSDYRAKRVKGDISTTFRWRSTSEQWYELTVYGSTHPTLSDEPPGNHHEVPYGGRLSARFGERDRLGMTVQIAGNFEDDPFQRNTFSTGDQRVQLLLGLERGALSKNQTHWRVSVGPTYFMDRPSRLEDRDDTRQLGYSVDGELTRLLRVAGITGLLDIGAQVSQSWGYISDAGGNNLDLTGRASLKPRVQIANTYLALGPVVYLSRTQSTYPTLDGFHENNAQLGIEVESAIRF